MSAGVVAMRLRLALLRHKMPIDVDLLLSDAAYAQEVLVLCKDVGEPGLIALAERAIASRLESAPRALDGPQPAPSTAPPVPSMRFSSGIKPATDSGSTAPQLPESAAPKAGGRASDAIDPAPLRERRYLRGAR